MTNLVRPHAAGQLQIDHGLADRVIGRVEQPGGELRQRVRGWHHPVAGKALARSLDRPLTELDTTLGLGLDEVQAELIINPRRQYVSSPRIAHSLMIAIDGAGSAPRRNRNPRQDRPRSEDLSPTSPDRAFCFARTRSRRNAATPDLPCRSATRARADVSA